MKFSGKMCFKMVLKVTKNQSFTLSLEEIFFENHRVVGQIDPPSFLQAVLGLIDEKSYKSILVYDISYKILFGLKPLRIGFDEVAGFIRVYDGIRYIVLLGPEKYDAIYNRTRYLISQKTDVTYVFFLMIMQ